MVLHRPKAGTYDDPASLTDFVEGCRVKRVVDDSQKSPPGTVLEVMDSELLVEWDYKDENNHERFSEKIEKSSTKRISYTCEECGKKRPIEYTAPVARDSEDDSRKMKVKCTGCCENRRDAEIIFRY